MAWRTRGSDVGVRTGGDEFLVLLPPGGLERVAAWRADRTSEQVLEAADSMLYAAKRGGKDRIMVETAIATPCT